MRKAIRLLISNVRDAGERVAEAVVQARGRLERVCVKLLSRDTALRETAISCSNEEGAQGIFQSLDRLDGVSVLGMEGVDRVNQP
jgi:hypothetical protein